MIYRWRLNNLFFPVILTIIATSCEKFSGDQEIPAYLAVDSIYLVTNYDTEGSDSQRITDAWIYVDDEFLGAFELPAKFPVLKSGSHSLKVWPGIKRNGIASTRVAYQYYTPVTRTIALSPDSTTRAGVLHSTYQSTAVFLWKEDFENVALSLDTTTRSSVPIQRTTGPPLTFERSHSGMAVMDTVHDFFECMTHAEYNIPSAPVYLEMNYNTSTELTVGVFTYGTTILYQTPIITLHPTEGQWKKIYIDLSTTLYAYSGMKTFRVYLGAFNVTGAEQSVVLFDNFKVVTREAK
jgi:hypothetical protein